MARSRFREFDGISKLFKQSEIGESVHADPAELAKRHEECSKNLRNSVLLFAAFAATCWTALSIPDIDLLVAQTQVKIPVVQIDVTLDKFLTVAPLIAVGLLIHSGLFQRRLSALNLQVGADDRVSTMFNLPGTWAQLAAFFLHIAVPLALLTFLFVKTLHRDDFILNVVIFALALLVLAELHIGRKVPNIVLHLAVAATGLALLACTVIPTASNRLRNATMLLFPLDYEGVDFTARKSLVLRNRSFYNANFFRTDLRTLNFSGTDFKNAKFSDAWLGDANFAGARLENADLGGVRADVANFEDAELKNAIFGSAKLTGVIFIEANLTEAEFVGATIDKADFSGANLTGASFKNASLKSAVFTAANLSGVDFEFADLEDVDYEDSNISGANFDGAKNVSRVDIMDQACADPANPPKGLHKDILANIKPCKN